MVESSSHVLAYTGLLGASAVIIVSTVTIMTIHTYIPILVELKVNSPPGLRLLATALVSFSVAFSSVAAVLSNS